MKKVNTECNKLKKLFKFASEKELKEHLKNCECCNKEYNDLNKTKLLTKDVAKYYVKRKENIPAKKLIQIAASLIIVILAIFTVYPDKYSQKDYVTENINNSTDSVIYKMGLPVDEYGLLVVY